MDIGQNAVEMKMDEPVFESVVRDQLFERRNRLQDALALSGGGLEFIQLLGQVDSALAKLENGTYGVCESCGESIPVARLEVLPYATKCVSCAART